MGFTVPDAAWRSSKTWSEKNLTTSTKVLVEVTPCFPEELFSKKIPIYLDEIFYLCSWPPSRNSCQQVHSTVFRFPIFFCVWPIFSKAGVDPCTHDLRSLRFIPAANQGLENVGRSLPSGCKIGTWGWYREIETDELKRIIFKLFDIMFPKCYIWDNDTLNKRGDGFAGRE